MSAVSTFVLHMPNLTNRLKEQRTSRKLTETRLAELLAVSQGSTTKGRTAT